VITYQSYLLISAIFGVLAIPLARRRSILVVLLTINTFLIAF